MNETKTPPARRSLNINVPVRYQDNEPQLRAEKEISHEEWGTYTLQVWDDVAKAQTEGGSYTTVYTVRVIEDGNTLYEGVCHRSKMVDHLHPIFAQVVEKDFERWLERQL